MNRSVNSTVPRRGGLVVALVSTLTLAASAAGCGADATPISVMTRNLFLGADLSPLTGALTPADLTALAGGVWREVEDSHFSDRALVLADEIVRADPDVVALQEVSLFRTQTPGDWRSGTAPNATTVALDFLQILQDALAARGAAYAVGTIGVNADEELPAVDGEGASLDIRMTDRDVTLVREGLAFNPAPGGSFEATALLPIGGAGGMTLKFVRGYASVDVTVGGKTVRIVNSHLEVGSLLGRLQEQQAQELASVLAVQKGRMVLTGDFNSRADGTGTASYSLLTTKAGSPAPFRDIWPFRQARVTSLTSQFVAVSTEFTCCLEIASATAVPQERIDLVLFRGAIDPVDGTVVETARTPSGLWPSDHLGVLAEFLLR